MKFSRDCGLDIKKTSLLVASLELCLSFVVVTFAIACWLTVDKPIQFVYEGPGENITSWEFSEPHDVIAYRQRGLEGCVITWCLTITLVFCAWRIISVAILALGVQKELPLLMQYWIIFKSFSVIMSIFILVAALTSSPAIPTASMSLAADLITAYFIRLLLSEIARVQKGSVTPSRATYRNGIASE